MSFMFNPTNYADPIAVNHISGEGLDTAKARFGMEAAQQILMDQSVIIGIDGYTAAPFDELCIALEAAARRLGIRLKILRTDCLWRDAREITEELNARCLPNDKKKDPTLLYGRLFDGAYEDLMRRDRLDAMVSDLKEQAGRILGKLIVCGAGALCAALCGAYDKRVWMDISPLRAVLNVKSGFFRNIGWMDGTPWEPKRALLRCYYVDFELAMKTRMRLFAHYEFDEYINGNKPDEWVWMPAALMKAIFRRGLEYPLRCRPIYLEGIWGGYYVMNRRALPDTMRNCAWVFDLIPMEVSIVFELEGREFEFPFYALVQAEGERLMGRRSVAKFGPYFPIRFNYDDTFHSNGNMSVQCHPTREYIRRENGEFDRQDESYYVVATDQGAKTYLGFRDGIEIADFVKAVKRSERHHTVMDYERYVNGIPSRPGMQFMIPAGTIHASGRNQLVLEIGSLTVGSYTYKMYDYLRLDLDGTPRPLHTYHGSRVLQPGRDETWVKENLVQNPRTIRRDDDYEEYVVGEHDLLYFSLRNVRFSQRYEDDTDGAFHVLVLVDGEKTMVRSLKNPSRCYEQNYLDVIVVPADFGAYEVVNLVKDSTVVMHKTLMKNDP